MAGKGRWTAIIESCDQARTVSSPLRRLLAQRDREALLSQLSIDLPEPVLKRLRKGATAAHMALEAFVAECVAATPLPLSDDLTPDARADLAPLEGLDDTGVWRVSRVQLSDEEQAHYDVLLDENERGALSAPDAELLRGHRRQGEASHATARTRVHDHAVARACAPDRS